MALHPEACEKCGAFFELKQDHSHSAGMHTVYDTPSGKLEPGNLFWAEWLPHKEIAPGVFECTTWKNSDGTIRSRGWTNCTGRHLYAVLPNGQHWDIDSRASNCTLPDDTEHRCWIRTGNPETEKVSAGKQGYTCSAGAGSIAAGDYHGFLTDGRFTDG